MALTSADATLSAALAETLQELDLADADAAVVRLAKTYALAIDSDPGVLKEIGPKLLACLVQLGATPQVRASLTKGQGVTPGGGQLAALREARRAN